MPSASDQPRSRPSSPRLVAGPRSPRLVDDPPRPETTNRSPAAPSGPPIGNAPVTAYELRRQAEAAGHNVPPLSNGTASNGGPNGFENHSTLTNQSNGTGYSDATGGSGN